MGGRVGRTHAKRSLARDLQLRAFIPVLWRLQVKVKVKGSNRSKPVTRHPLATTGQHAGNPLDEPQAEVILRQGDEYLTER